MEILGKEVDRRIIFVFAAIVVALVAVGLYLMLTQAKTGREGELFALMPGDGLSGVAYAEIEQGGFEEVGRLVPFAQNYTGKIQGLALAMGSYGDGSSAVAARVKTTENPEYLAMMYGGLSGGYETEYLTINGKEITVIYSKTDSERKNPICAWKTTDGMGILAVSSGSIGSAQCNLKGDMICRGQAFQDGTLSVKVKSSGERLIATDAACGAASLSSKNLRYVQLQDTPVASDGEYWLDGIPCYDAAGNLAKGNSFSGKVFIKYYLESEGAGSPRLVSGDVVAISALSGGNGVGALRCVDLLEKQHDPATALSLLARGRKLGSGFGQANEMFGTAIVSSEKGDMYASAYKKEDVDYLLSLNKGSLASSVLQTGKQGTACYGILGGSAEMLEKNGMFACKRSLDAGLARVVSIERKTGEGVDLVVVGLTNGTLESVETGVSETAFGTAIAGYDLRWMNETTGVVRVYSINSSAPNEGRKPVEGAVVELYPSAVMGNVMRPIDARNTDSLGTVVFEHVPLAGAIARAGKTGYRTSLQPSATADGLLAEETNFTTELYLEPASTGQIVTGYLASSAETRLDAGIPESRGTFPELASYRIELVDSNGSIRGAVMVGKNAPAEEVAAASRIAEIIAARGYTCKQQVLKGEFKAEPFNLASVKILFTDDSTPGGTIIAVGNPETNKALLKTGISKDAGPIAKESGNVIAVVGSGEDAMTAARRFVSGLKLQSNGCGGDSYFGNTRIIDSTGKPIAKVVIGKFATTQEALAGAYIATTIASLSARCTKTTEDTVGCVPAEKPEMMVFDEDSVPSGYSLISVGGPAINGLAYRNCEDCRNVAENSAVIRVIGNDTYVAGYRMDDTLFAANEFASLVGSPVPSYQSKPYYAIMVSGWTKKDSGHNEVSISFYDSYRMVGEAKATVGDFYMLNGRMAAQVNAVYVRSAESAFVAFDVNGQTVSVPIGSFLCQGGTVERDFRFCVTPRENTTLNMNYVPNPAVLMGWLRVYADYLGAGGPVEDGTCRYCITGTKSVCRNLPYDALHYDYYGYRDEFVLKDLPVGQYYLQVNCSADGYENATKKVGLNVTKLDLPDLIVDGLSVDSLVNTKITMTVSIRNAGIKRLAASSTNPLVVCLWDQEGRNLYSYVSQNATIDPGRTFSFTLDLKLFTNEGNNTVSAKADCNNIFSEENEDNNEKEIRFGRYG